MKHYSCSNGAGYRFTLVAKSAEEALSRAITQFTIHGQYNEPIMASCMTDPCDYYSTHQLKDDYIKAEVNEAEMLEALNQLNSIDG